MVKNKQLDSVRLAIAQNRLSEAISHIIDFAKNIGQIQYNQSIVISMEIENITSAVRTGRIDWDVENNSKRKIANRMLQLWSDLECEVK